MGLLAGLIGSALAVLALGGWLWTHDKSVATEARDAQRIADEKVYNVCVADKDLATNENAKMALTMKGYEDRVKEQNKAIEDWKAMTQRMGEKRVREAIKAQDRIIKLDAEMIDLDLALKQRNADMTCDPRIVAMLKAALVQQRRDHPGSGKILEPIADKPVVIKP